MKRRNFLQAMAAAPAMYLASVYGMPKGIEVKKLTFRRSLPYGITHSPHFLDNYPIRVRPVLYEDFIRYERVINEKDSPGRSLI